MASMTTALLEAHIAGGQIQFIVNDQDAGGGYFVEAGQCSNGQPRTVHEGIGLEQPHGLALVVPPGDSTMKGFVDLQVELVLPCKLIDPPEADVVSGLRVFIARIAQANQ
jgi:hypothetical protein